MSHIQIRNVPDDVHRTLKARAAVKGQSLSEYLLAEITELARLPTLDELAERIRSHGPALTNISAAELVREARAERERELADR
jgi:plasmid stability protein